MSVLERGPKSQCFPEQPSPPLARCGLVDDDFNAIHADFDPSLLCNLSRAISEMPDGLGDGIYPDAKDIFLQGFGFQVHGWKPRNLDPGNLLFRVLQSRCFAFCKGTAQVSDIEDNAEWLGGCRRPKDRSLGRH